MSLSYRIAAGLTCLLIVGPAFAAEAPLGIGSDAPKLEVKEFVKGEPVKQLEKNKIYVVEFWATWCGPCKTSIPHLTEIQKKHKDIVVIGVSVLEEMPADVAPFVKKMGAKMDYRVAIDLVPEKAEPEDGKMAKNWMKAAKQNGIPAAFIVNGDGKIAWIGHPSEMDKPLEKIIAGKWDIAVAARREKNKTVIEERLNKAILEKPEEVIKFLDAQFGTDQELEIAFSFQKLHFLTKIKDGDAKVLEYATRLMEKLHSDDARALAEIAELIMIAQDGKPTKEVKALALKALLRADGLSKEKDIFIASMLAEVHMAHGDSKNAVKTQERAIKLARADDELGEKVVKTLERRLKEYKEAEEKK